jgi:threonine dehydrogenase-like Zn-dependent dehydrogenase
MRIMGFHRDGGFADYVVAPLKSLIPLPEELSDEQAVFAEPLPESFLKILRKIERKRR